MLCNSYICVLVVFDNISEVSAFLVVERIEQFRSNCLITFQSFVFVLSFEFGVDHSRFGAQVVHKHAASSALTFGEDQHTWVFVVAL